jgi:hypothetical protein
MHLLMIIKLLAAKLALADLILVLVRGDGVLHDGVAVAVFHRLGDVAFVLGTALSFVFFFADGLVCGL